MRIARLEKNRAALEASTTALNEKIAENNAEIERIDQANCLYGETLKLFKHATDAQKIVFEAAACNEFGLASQPEQRRSRTKSGRRQFKWRRPYHGIIVFNEKHDFLDAYDLSYKVTFMLYGSGDRDAFQNWVRADPDNRSEEDAQIWVDLRTSQVKGPLFTSATAH